MNDFKFNPPHIVCRRICEAIGSSGRPVREIQVSRKVWPVLRACPEAEAESAENKPDSLAAASVPPPPVPAEEGPIPSLNPTPDLTDRQAEILAFIGDQIASGMPPTTREICEQFRFASTNSVALHLATLESKGYIVRALGSARGIRILKGHPAAALAFHSRIGEGNAKRTTEYLRLMLAEVCEALELVEAIGWDRAREYAAQARRAGGAS